MKIKRWVDIDARIGDGRTVRLQEEIEFEISGAEAMMSVFADSEGREVTERNLKALLNNFAAFIKNVPDAEIARLSPELRLMVVGFLEGSAKRFQP